MRALVTGRRVTRRLVAGCLVASAAFGAGCGGSSAPPLSAADEAAIGSGAVCDALDGLADLRMALANDAYFASGAPLGANIALHERLAETRTSTARITKADPSAAISKQLLPYEHELDGYTTKLDAAATKLHATFDAASAALDDVMICQGVHVVALRKVSKELPLSLVERFGPASAEENAEAAAIAKTNVCAPNARLGALFADMSLAAPITIRRIGAQAKEISLDPAGKALRDRALPPLFAHADALEAYVTLLADVNGQAPEARRTLVKLGNDLSDTLKDTHRACLHREVLQEPEGATTTDTRSVVVTVRPKWSGKLKELAGGSGGFGSGFLVRAHTPDGKLETLVVTNRHVMEGALEADVTPAGADVSTADLAKKAAVQASLLFLDPNDDVAILRFGGDAQGRFSERSVKLRAKPVTEQEGVVAAGFPAVGMQPSYQVTKGIISNSHFGGGDDDVGVAFIQHTAPIDAGNSGGPLLDDEGLVVGINTAKIRGRENTNLAIPTTRIMASLARISRPRVYNADHAQATCDGALAALSAGAPTVELLSRFSRVLFEAPDDAAPSSPEAAALARVNYRAAITGAPTDPLSLARIRGYELIRRRTDAAGGVAPFTRCEAKGREASDGSGTFTMAFRTRTGAEHTITLTPEDGELRVSALK